MPWRLVARALALPACCLAVNLAAVAWARSPANAASPGLQRLATAASIVAAGCASVLVALPAGVFSLILIARRAQSGGIDPFKACRASYHLAMELAGFVGTVSWTAYLATAGAWGRASPLILVAVVGVSIAALVVLKGRLTIGLAIGLSFVLWDTYGQTAILRGVAPPLWLLALLAAAAANALRNPPLAFPPSPEQGPIPLPGRPLPNDAAPTLRALLEAVLRPEAPPPNVVLGLNPGIAFLERDVLAGEELLSGGTLYLSLPLCRVLDRGEFAGLVAFEVAYVRSQPPRWRSFIRNAGARVSEFLGRRLPGRFPRAALAAACLPVEVWTEIWGRLDTAILLSAVRRGATVAGRETFACAIVKQLVPPPPLQDIVAEQGEPGEDRNFSRDLAARLQAVLVQSDFLRPFEVIATLSDALPGVAAIIRALNVESADVASRVGASAPDPAIGLIDGAEDLERDLTRVILQEAASAQPDEIAERAKNAAFAARLTVNRDWVRRVTNPDVRPDAVREGMFMLPRKDRSIEGPILLVAAILFGVLFGWGELQPYLHHVFPERGTTKTGPAGFPVTVRIGENELAVTSHANEAWNCRVVLGFPAAGRSYDRAFSVDPGQTRYLPYIEFRSGELIDPEGAREMAHRRIGLECVGPSGESHRGGW